MASGDNISKESVKKTFPVLNMSCASCAGSVQSMLNAQPGVINAAVNFAAGNVLVEYKPAEAAPSDMKKVIQSIGYDLVLEDGPQATATAEEAQKKN